MEVHKHTILLIRTSHSLQTDSGFPLLRTTSIQLTEYGDVRDGAYIEPSFLCSNIFGIGEHSLCYQKRKVNTKSAINLLSIMVY